MAITSLSGWAHDGRPFVLCTPGADLAATFQAQGYTVGAYPDAAHLAAAVPEDHCPYSHTPWPGEQPYPHGMAIDIMPRASGPSLADIGARILADKQAGLAALAPLKYMNWTDAAGSCWHESWQPGYARRASTDVGHIHLSFRTDYVDSKACRGYDPVAALLGGDDEMAKLVRVNQGGAVWVTSGPHRHWLTTQAEYAAAVRVYGPAIPIDQTELGAFGVDVTATGGGGLVLTPEQLAEITAAAEAGAEKGAEDAIDGATFDLPAATIHSAPEPA